MKHRTKRRGVHKTGDELPGSLQSWLPIQDIREGIILTRMGEFIKLLEILPINFRYLSDEEQTRIVGEPFPKK